MVEVVFYLLIGLTGVCISWIDYRQHVIYDYQSGLLLVLIFFQKALQDRLSEFCYGILLALAVNMAVFGVVYLVYHEEQYGMGDVILHGCIGALLGPWDYVNYYILSTMVIAVAGSVYGLVRHGSLRVELPLAPWLFGVLVLFLAFGKPDICSFLF